MNTEAILTQVNAALNEIDHSVTPRDTLQRLAKDLTDQLRREIAASRGSLNALKAIQAILNPNEKCRPGLAYPWIDAAGRQCICDGYQAFRLNDGHHQPLPERPENVSDHIDLDKIIPAAPDGMKSLPMPSAAEIKQVIALQRAEYTGKRNSFRALYDFGEHAPTVNAALLLNVATIFPAVKTLYWTTLVTPLYFACDDGDGVILPIRVEGKRADDAAAKPADKTAEPANPAETERSETIPADNPIQAEIERAAEAIRQAIDKQAIYIRKHRDATSSGLKAEYADEVNKAAVAEGKARLNLYAAQCKIDPLYTMHPEEFARIISRLYVKMPA